jgi:CheY-like chemotaxis protein
MDTKRVLLIDDEETFTRVLRSYLERTGRYEVRVEHSGTRGVLAATAFHPDIIFLDVIMPDMDGGHVASELAQDPSTKRVPIVFLTAVVSREEARAHEGVISGQLFLAKPISANEVLQCLERYLGGQRVPEGRR